MNSRQRLQLSAVLTFGRKLADLQRPSAESPQHDGEHCVQVTSAAVPRPPRHRFRAQPSTLCVFLQSFFGFGQGAETEIVLDNVDSRRMAEVKGEDGKKEKHFLFYDGETVSGKVRRLIINA
jgi:Vacuolar protein sorting-associated protein 26